jgi:hypothetical protein
MGDAYGPNRRHTANVSRRNGFQQNLRPAISRTNSGTFLGHQHTSRHVVYWGRTGHAETAEMA